MNGLPRHCADRMPGVCFGPLLLGAMVVGTAAAAVGSYSQAQFQAGVMKQNAKIATQNAGIAATQGQQQEYEQSLKTRAEVGQQKATQAANNVTGPSAANVVAGTQQAGELDQSNLKFNTMAQINNYNTQSQQDMTQSNSLKTAAPINAFSTILGGASSLGSTWLKFQQFGSPGFGLVNG